jgi:hypothetical protein
MENGKIGYISSSGKIICTPVTPTFEMNGEKLVNKASRMYSRNPKSEDPKTVFLTLNDKKTSLILKNNEGELLDEYSLLKDTIEMYFFVYDYHPSNPGEITEIGMVLPVFNSEEEISLKEKGIYDNHPIKIGVKNENGEVIIPPIKVINGLSKLRREGYIRTINNELVFCNDKLYRNGEVLLEADRQTVLDKDLIRIQKGSEFGLMNMKGDILIPYQKKEIKFFSDNKIILSSGEGVDQLVSLKGDTLLEAAAINLEYGSHDGGGFVRINNHIVARVDVSLEDSVYGFINSEGKWLIKPEKHTRSKELVINIVSKDLLKTSIYDRNSHEIIKQGVINLKGEELLKLKDSTDIKILSDQWVKITEMNNDSLTYFQNVYSGEKLSIKEKNITIQLFTCSEGEFVVVREKKDNNESVYAVKGDKLEKIAQKLDKVDITMSERQNVIIIKNKDGYCLYDPLKAKVVSKSFDYLTFGASVLPYEKNHFFIAEQNKKKGLINDKGKWVIEPIYYNLLPFSGELTLAQSDSLSFQYININGETLWKLPEDDKTAWNRTHFLESFSDCTPLIFKGEFYNLTL